MSSKLFKKVDSSDYINYKKRTAIASEYKNASAPNLNPVKTNGSQYNENFIFVPTITDSSNCLLQAKSYELKQNYNYGVNYLTNVCDVSGNI